MRDLFGNDRPEPASKVKAIALDLFGAAAERKALESGRPVSQEKASIMVPQPWVAPTCEKHGTVLLLEAGGQRKYSCPRCA